MKHFKKLMHDIILIAIALLILLTGVWFTTKCSTKQAMREMLESGEFNFTIQIPQVQPRTQNWKNI